MRIINIIFATAIAFPRVAFAHKQPEIPSAPAENCAKRLSYRLRNHAVFTALVQNGLPKAEARKLERKFRFINTTDASVRLFQMIEQNLAKVREITDHELLYSVKDFMLKDLELLDLELPKIDATPNHTQNAQIEILLQRALQSENRLHEFLKMNYRNPEWANNIFVTVISNQMALYPTFRTSYSDGDADTKMEAIAEGPQATDPVLMHDFANMVQAFRRKVGNHKPVTSVYIPYVDTMFKIIYIWDRFYSLRRMYLEKTVFTEKPQSLHVLDGLSEIVANGKGTRNDINRQLDRFLNDVSVDLMHAEAMFYGAEPTDKVFLKNLIDRFEEFAEKFSLAQP